MEEKWKCYGYPALAVLAAAICGGYFVDVYSPWYQNLNLPSFQPAGYVFAFAWTLIYLFTYAAFARDCLHKRHHLLYLYGLNLAFNALWPFVFFFLQAPSAAFVVNVLLFGTVILLIVKSDAINRLLLLPYFIWMMVALALNYAIVLMN